MSEDKGSWELSVQGLVQGVGFRPFVYRLAAKNHLKGWVQNTNASVCIAVEGTKSDYQSFIQALREEHPVAARIHSIEESERPWSSFHDFQILESTNYSDAVTQISPDITVCEDCLLDMKHQEHRLDYPFINCTNCGPRFSIIRDLPYDRKMTTMEPFAMCDKCREEYDDISDRRFHAQPVACSFCGPAYELLVQGTAVRDIHAITEKIDEILIRRGVVAIKGLGGFQLICDALNEEAIAAVRSIKKRDEKPFAVMMKDLDTVRDYAFVNEAEAGMLQSWRRPIVLLGQKKPLPAGINQDLNQLGVILPYLPLHYLLLGKIHTPVLVFTSGNLSEEPLITANQEASEAFAGKADAVLVYDREIHNRVDDSLGMVVHSRERLLRRARGYVPEPLELPFSVDGILAAGAELVNCFCLGKGNHAMMSQHIGDLKNYATYRFYTETMVKFRQMFRVDPECIVHDLHPDYMSTAYAQESGLSRIGVQHHHAHIAACMAEHQLDEPVIGVCFDGTGYGEDGNIWGGEFMYAGYDGYERYAHLDYLPLPGGEKAIREPWRTGLSFLYQTFGADVRNLDIPFIRELDREKSHMVLTALDKKLNTPLSSGAGRLFDAIAAILKVCTVSGHHAQAPMQLESLVNPAIHEQYSLPFAKEIQLHELVRQLVDDIRKGLPVATMATKFHNSMLSLILAGVKTMQKQYPTRKTVLSGGVFQNRYLLTKAEELLGDDAIIYTPRRVPCNDAGIALGQLAIGAKRMKREMP